MRERTKCRHIGRWIRWDKPILQYSFWCVWWDSKETWNENQGNSFQLNDWVLIFFFSELHLYSKWVRFHWSWALPIPIVNKLEPEINKQYIKQWNTFVFLLIGMKIPMGENRIWRELRENVSRLNTKIFGEKKLNLQVSFVRSKNKSNSLDAYFFAENFDILKKSNHAYAWCVSGRWLRLQILYTFSDLPTRF